MNNIARRSALKTRKPLRAKTGLRPVSPRRQVQLKLEAELRAKLMAECKGLCKRCGNSPDWRGLEMHHLIPRSLGGITDEENCQMWCCPCHYGEDGHRLERS